MNQQENNYFPNNIPQNSYVVDNFQNNSNNNLQMPIIGGNYPNSNLNQQNNTINNLQNPPTKKN